MNSFTQARKLPEAADLYAPAFRCLVGALLGCLLVNAAAHRFELVSTGIRDDGVKIFDTLLKMCRGCVSNFR